MTKVPTLVFIGGGNMATALISGLIVDGTAADSIIVAEPNEQKRERLAAHFGVRTREDNQGAAEQADILILAIKPQMMQQICRDLSAALQQRQPLCLSIAAGIRHKSLQQWLGAGIPIVRTMPNTPSMLQAGATGLYAGDAVTSEQKNAAERIMRAVGMSIWVEDETQLDAITALSGSGPAYFFLFMEAMQQSAEKLGLTTETSHLFALQTALGAARMAMENDTSLVDLRSSVTSKGGTTEQAIMSFEESGLRDIVHKAMSRARDRSIDLSRQLATEK